jgi:hypothetical protein
MRAVSCAVRMPILLALVGAQSLASAFLLQTPWSRGGDARAAGARRAPRRDAVDRGWLRAARSGARAPALRMTATDPRVTARTAPGAGAGAPEGVVVRYYDTTLRDGAQGEGISLSCDDKLRIAARLSKFGADYIEAGWPGSNPKDAEFFQRAVGELSPEAWRRVVAFGSTRYKNVKVEEDKQVQMLVESNARTVTLVGKAWDLHVDQVLETTREENLGMIRDTVRDLGTNHSSGVLYSVTLYTKCTRALTSENSCQVRYLRGKGIEVMLDAEHFYDGYRANAAYAMECLGAAVEAEVDWLVLCDTNGGSLPWDVEEVTRKVSAGFYNIHTRSIYDVNDTHTHTHTHTHIYIYIYIYKYIHKYIHTYINT